jgi:uncharacterized protein YhaN
MFALDHRTLEEGGKAILRGEGRVGELLFAAGAGTSDLRDILDTLGSEAGALFKSGGSRPELNAALNRLDSARAELRTLQLSTAEWEKQDAALRRAESQGAVVRADLEAANRELNRLRRIEQAIPLAAERVRRHEAIAGYGDAPRLPDDFGSRYSTAASGLQAALRSEAAAQQAIDDRDEKLRKIEVPDNLLAQAAAIELLRDQLGGYRKAQQDLPNLEGKRDQVEADAMEILRTLRPDLDRASAESIRLIKKQQVEIQNLGTRASSVAERRQRTADEVAELNDDLRRLTKQLDAMEIPPDPDPLESVVRRVQAEGDLERSMAGLALQVREAEEEARVDLGSLPHWTGELEALETLAVPPPETIDRFDQALGEATQEVKRLRRRIEEENDRASASMQEIERLELGGAVPSEQELETRRARRDHGWDLVYRAWKTGEEENGEVERFVSEDEAAADLAGAYVQSVAGADAVADGLYHEADRVATAKTLRLNLSAVHEHLRRLDGEVTAVEQKRAQEERDWRALWAPLGIEPLSPGEMRGWVQRQQGLARRIGEIRQLRARHATVESTIRTFLVELDRALAATGSREELTERSLMEALDLASRIAVRLRTAHQERAQLARELEELERKLPAVERIAEGADAALRTWQEDWANAMATLGLPSDAAPAQANEVMAQIDVLFSKLKEADTYAGRIRGIRRDSGEFAEAVARCTESVAPDLIKLPAAEAAAQLIQRLQEAATARDRRDSLRQELETWQEELQKSRKLKDECSGQLEALCTEARCGSPKELPEADRVSRELHRLHDRLETAESALLRLTAGDGLEEFLQVVESVDADDLPNRIRKQEDRIEQGESRKSELDQAIGSARSELARMDGSEKAAATAEDCEETLAQLGSGVLRYARLKLASAVLRQAIERYREKNQGSIMERARDLFVRLTVGSFADLRLDYNERDEPVLVGIRGGSGEPVGIEGMSDGTADQLYLAMRLASISAYFDTHPPLPFILDDILVNFDNDRALATLQVLAELSAKTQVIFLTHHQHIVDLARAHLEEGVLFTHRLSWRDAPDPAI